MNPLPWLRMAPWLAILLVLAWAVRLEQRRAYWHDQFTVEHDQRIVDQATYAGAQVIAEAKNKAEIEHIVATRKQSDEKVTHALQGNIGTLRDLAATGRLRPQIAAAQRPASSAKASPSVEAPCRVIDPTWLCLSSDDVLRAAENEERHDRLIDAAEGQAAVVPNVKP